MIQNVANYNKVYLSSSIPSLKRNNHKNDFYDNPLIFEQKGSYHDNVIMDILSGNQTPKVKNTESNEKNLNIKEAKFITSELLKENMNTIIQNLDKIKINHDLKLNSKSHVASRNILNNNHKTLTISNSKQKENLLTKNISQNKNKSGLGVTILNIDNKSKENSSRITNIKSSTSKNQNEKLFKSQTDLKSPKSNANSKNCKIENTIHISNLKKNLKKPLFQKVKSSFNISNTPLNYEKKLTRLNSKRLITVINQKSKFPPQESNVSKTSHKISNSTKNENSKKSVSNDLRSKSPSQIKNSFCINQSLYNEIKDINKKINNLQNHRPETKIINIKIYTNNNKVYNNKINVPSTNNKKNAENRSNIKDQCLKEEYFISSSEKMNNSSTINNTSNNNIKFLNTNYNINTETSQKKSSKIIPIVRTNLYQENNKNSSDIINNNKKMSTLTNLSVARMRRYDAKNSNSSSVNKNLSSEENKNLIISKNRRLHLHKNNFNNCLFKKDLVGSSSTKNLITEKLTKRILECDLEVGKNITLELKKNHNAFLPKSTKLSRNNMINLDPSILYLDENDSKNQTSNLLISCISHLNTENQIESYEFNSNTKESIVKDSIPKNYLNLNDSKLNKKFEVSFNRKTMNIYN